MRPCCDFVPQKYLGKYGTKLRPVMVKLCHQYRSRILFAAGNPCRPAAISAGKQNATPVVTLQTDRQLMRSSLRNFMSPLLAFRDCASLTTRDPVGLSRHPIPIQDCQKCRCDSGSRIQDSGAKKPGRSFIHVSIICSDLRRIRPLRALHVWFVVRLSSLFSTSLAPYVLGMISRSQNEVICKSF